MDLKITRGSYKSLQTGFKWLNIPSGISVLTGPNGAGKTQIIELIDKVAKKDHNVSGIANLSKDFEKDSALLIDMSDGFQREQITTQDVSNQRNNIVNKAKNYYRIRDNITPFSRRNFSDNEITFFDELLKQLEGKFSTPIGTISDRDIYHYLAENSLFPKTIESRSIVWEIADTFYRYFINNVNAILQRKRFPHTGYTRELGTPPWEVTNEIFRSAGLDWQFIPPKEVGIPYILQIQNMNGSNVFLDSLSTGENALLRLSLMVYNLKKNGIAPELILIDEFDSHLHPQSVQHYYNALQTYFVEGHGCTVILSTHRPDTLALIPDGQIFEVLPQGDERIRPISKAEAIGKLSGNLFTIVQNTTCVFVEDKEDAQFYASVIKTISESYEAGIQPLHFIPVSTRDKSGGKNKVKEWTKKFRLVDFPICGLIDRDNGEVAADKLYVLNRYSLENYLFDPLVVYAALIDSEHWDSIKMNLSFNKVSPGSEANIQNLSPQELQAIVDFVCGEIESTFKEKGQKFDSQKVNVYYPNELVLSYPSWVINMRGHNIQKFVNIHFTRLDIDSAYRRLKMVPLDLIDLLQNIAQAHQKAETSKNAT